MYHIYTIEANDFIWHMKICVENKSKTKKNKYTNLTKECPVNSGSQKHKLIC